MSCTHRGPGKYAHQIYDWWTEETEEVWVEGQSTQVDIGIGAFRCTQCGEIGYYTDKWKQYYEFGTPCPGSENAPRIPALEKDKK